FYSVAALEPKFWSTLCEALASPDLIAEQYSTAPDVQEAVERIFATRTRDEWEERLAGLDVCCEPVLELDEVTSHPQVVARRLFERSADGRAPRLGEHTEEILKELGL
ncbi:MAG TPA: CoA transferase, partial [Candidatus Dormibacteraeota bacterium]|nr:CoA transferase [Candidatus Dormibacteraeota bacterium]